MKEISTLIFDFGNVITRQHDEGCIAEMMDLLGTGLTRQEFLKTYFAFRGEYDRGAIDYRTYWTRVTRELHLAVTETTMDALKEVDLRSWFVINDSMVAFIRRTRDKVRHVVLLSNMHWDGLHYLEDNLGWKGLFDERIYSCAVSINKPDAAIYRLAVDRVDERCESCLFTDDLEENVAGARRAGLNAVRFTGLADYEACLGRDYRLVR